MCAETLSMGRITDPDRRQQYLDRILAESERLSTMIGDILDFSRLRQGALTYRLAETAIGDTVDTVVRQYLPEWERRGARLELSIDERLPPVAHDAGAIRQVLLNLVDNAIEHGGDRQGICVRLTAKDGMVTLAVTDHGRGISEASKRELRRSMRRGQVAAAAAGSGLGLALVQQISNVHRARFVLGNPAEHGGVEATIAFPAISEAV
jgi:signal transduction histidine kinase